MVRREAAKASVLIPPPADEGALTAKPPNNVYVTDNGMPFLSSPEKRDAPKFLQVLF